MPKTLCECSWKMGLSNGRNNLSLWGLQGPTSQHLSFFTIYKFCMPDHLLQCGNSRCNHNSIVVNIQMIFLQQMAYLLHVFKCWCAAAWSTALLQNINFHSSRLEFLFPLTNMLDHHAPFSIHTHQQLVYFQCCIFLSGKKTNNTTQFLLNVCTHW